MAAAAPATHVTDSGSAAASQHHLLRTLSLSELASFVSRAREAEGVGSADGSSAVHGASDSGAGAGSTARSYATTSSTGAVAVEVGAGVRGRHTPQLGAYETGQTLGPRPGIGPSGLRPASPANGREYPRSRHYSGATTSEELSPWDRKAHHSDRPAIAATRHTARVRSRSGGHGSDDKFYDAAGVDDKPMTPAPFSAAQLLSAVRVLHNDPSSTHYTTPRVPPPRARPSDEGVVDEARLRAFAYPEIRDLFRLINVNGRVGADELLLVRSACEGNTGVTQRLDLLIHKMQMTGIREDGRSFQSLVFAEFYLPHYKAAIFSDGDASIALVRVPMSLAVMTLKRKVAFDGFYDIIAKKRQDKEAEAKAQAEADARDQASKEKRIAKAANPRASLDNNVTRLRAVVKANVVASRMLSTTAAYDHVFVWAVDPKTGTASMARAELETQIADIRMCEDLVTLVSSDGDAFAWDPFGLYAKHHGPPAGAELGGDVAVMAIEADFDFVPPTTGGDVADKIQAEGGVPVLADMGVLVPSETAVADDTGEGSDGEHTTPRRPVVTFAGDPARGASDSRRRSTSSAPKLPDEPTLADLEDEVFTRANKCEPPTLSFVLWNTAVACLSVSSKHAAVVSRGGVYTWGLPDKGRLGHARTKSMLGAKHPLKRCEWASSLRKQVGASPHAHMPLAGYRTGVSDRRCVAYLTRCSRPYRFTGCANVARQTWTP